jgi:spore coat polysaccharide biosynthesis protein SpsF (cytidylyltransferase family)
MILIQARTGSTRLPNKVLFNIDGEPIISKIYKRCDKIERTMVIIPTGDNKLSDALYQRDIPFFQGHPTNVLERYYEAAFNYKVDWVIRITADCPFIPREIIKYIADLGQKEEIDFCSNVFPPRTYPNGWDCEFMSFKFLEYLYNRVKEDEHVTSDVYKNLSHYYGKFRIKKVTLPYDLSDIRLTIDTRLDYDKLIKKEKIRKPVKKEQKELKGKFIPRIRKDKNINVKP